MAKILKEYSDKTGWSRWIPPVMRGYKMACCDCGLVHDMNFKVMRVTKRLKNGDWHSERVSGLKVMFKARRNERSTAAMRREEAKRAKSK
jgi:hypothetical protein